MYISNELHFEDKTHLCKTEISQRREGLFLKVIVRGLCLRCAPPPRLPTSALAD